MNILVTGGAGYIGCHIVRALIKKGYDIVVYDNLSKGHVAAVPGIPLVVGDINDSHKLTETIKNYSIKAVIHFAASSLVGESAIQPSKYYHNNVVNTISLLDTLIENGVNKFVFSSTAAVYGEPREVPITEDCPKEPTNVYGKSKLMVENILESYDKAYGLKYISLRYFNAAGADLAGDIGEDHTPETHLLPIIMEVALGKRHHLNIFGNDYNTPDGTCIRDYIHVNDLAEAHVLALESLLQGNDSQVYNLGNGHGFSVQEVVDVARKVTGHSIPTIISGRREGDPAVLIASSKRAITELKWQPKFHSLEKIITTAWEWHKNNPFGYGDKELGDEKIS